MRGCGWEVSTYSAVLKRLKRCRLQTGCSETGAKQNNQFFLQRPTSDFLYEHDSGKMKCVELSLVKD